MKRFNKLFPYVFGTMVLMLLVLIVVVAVSQEYFRTGKAFPFFWLP